MSEYEDKIKISFDTNADQTKQQVDGVAKAINNTTDATEQQAVAQKSLRQQMRNANMELQNTINKYGETSKEAIASAKAVANLKDQMEFAQQLSKSFNPDQKFKALTSASQLAGTGLQGVTSGMALFGDQSKDTQQQLLKVQAAMAFSDAISNLSNVADQWKVLKTSISQATTFQKANNAVTGTATILQNAFTGSVNTTSFGFKALKVAIASTGIGLLVTGVALLVNNFDSLKAIVLKAVPQLEAIGKVIKGITQSVTDFLGFTSEADRVLDKQKSNAEKALKQNEKYLAENEHKLTEAQKKDIELRNEHFKRVSEGTMSNDKSAKIYNEKLGIEKKEAQDKINKELLEKQKKADEDKRAKQKQHDDEIKRIAQEKAKSILSKEAELQKQLEDLQDNTEQKKLDRQKQREAKEIELLGATGKQKQDLLLNLDKIYQEKQNELNEKNKLAEEEKQKEKIAKAKEYFEQFKLEQDEKAKYEDAKTEEELNKILEKAQAKIEKEEEAKQLEAEALGEDANLTPEEREEKKLEIQAFYNQRREEEENRHKDAVISIDRAKAEQKKEIQDAIFGIADAGIGVLKSFDSKNKAIQKATILAESGVALGKVGINIAAGVSKDASTGAIASIPQIAKTVATGVLSTAQIISGTSKALKALGTGGSVSGGATAQAPQGVSAQPQVGVQASSENQIATSIARSQSEQAPIKAYVVSSDVSTAQVLDAKLISENSF